MKKKIIYTIGHSTRAIEEFVDLLKSNKIKQVVDIRTIPKSRHNPQFNKEVMQKNIRNRKIGYRHFKKLGGLRRAKKNSLNNGWQNLSFRGFADYMAEKEFQKGIDKLEEIATNKITVIMCAEAVPWRCHRSLIADALTLQGWKVFHIMSKTSVNLHKITAFLKINGGKITYP